MWLRLAAVPRPSLRPLQLHLEWARQGMPILLISTTSASTMAWRFDEIGSQNVHDCSV